MSHDHHHIHDIDISSRAVNRKRLLITLILLAIFMVAEFVGGLLANSLALIADAGHMLSDVAAITISFFAIWISQRPPVRQHTYGFFRTEIFAALFNGVALVVISIIILIEAFERFSNPPEVLAPLMIGVASVGLIVHLTGLFILSGGRTESLNVRAAWLHVLTDALGGIGVIISGGLIWAFGWYIADPIASVLIGLLVLFSACTLIKEAVRILMEVAPGHLDADKIRTEIKSLSGVSEVHDLHIWTVTTGRDVLTGHVIIKSDTNALDILHKVHEILHDRFGLDHITIQVEPEDFDEEECTY
ncbi:MAG: cation diffusion facilitator family transporter [bacterium]